MKRIVRILIENTPVAYIVLDKDYRVHYINEFFLKFRKIGQGEGYRAKVLRYFNGGIPCDHCAVRQSIESGRNVSILRKDVPTARFVTWMISPFRFEKITPKRESLTTS